MNDPLVQKTQYYLNESHRLNEALNEEKEYTSFLEEEIINILEGTFVGPQGGIAAGMNSDDPKQRLKAQIAARHLPKLLAIAAAHNASLKNRTNPKGMSGVETIQKGGRISSLLRTVGSLDANMSPRHGGIVHNSRSEPRWDSLTSGDKFMSTSSKIDQEAERTNTNNITAQQRQTAASTAGRKPNNYVAPQPAVRQAPSQPAKKPGLLKRFKNYISNRLVNTSSV
ncbi:MAG: hypothetical protein EB127_02995 [Alphaproteobacteria bacterium]|nr:hypothetical protein [Alphaproteobacteria bacterium]